MFVGSSLVFHCFVSLFGVFDPLLLYPVIPSPPAFGYTLLNPIIYLNIVFIIFGDVGAWKFLSSLFLISYMRWQSMIELSRTQDEEVGDGTTSVIVLGIPSNLEFVNASNCLI